MHRRRPGTGRGFRASPVGAGPHPGGCQPAVHMFHLSLSTESWATTVARRRHNEVGWGVGIHWRSAHAPLSPRMPWQAPRALRMRADGPRVPLRGTGQILFVRGRWRRRARSRAQVLKRDDRDHPSRVLNGVVAPYRAHGVGLGTRRPMRRDAPCIEPDQLRFSDRLPLQGRARAGSRLRPGKCLPAAQGAVRDRSWQA